MLFGKREKREYSSDIVIAQRLPVLVLFMFIRSSIMGEGNHSSSILTTTVQKTTTVA